MSYPSTCRICNSTEIMVLGSTGYRTYYRCRYCGGDFNVKDNPCALSSYPAPRDSNAEPEPSDTSSRDLPLPLCASAVPPRSA